MENKKPLDETEAIKQATDVARIMLDTTKRYDEQNKRLWVALLAFIGAFLIAAVCAVYMVANGQKMMDEAMWKALNAAGEVTVTTTTTSVNRDTGEGSGNNVYQAEGSTYNESGVE